MAKILCDNISTFHSKVTSIAVRPIKGRPQVRSAQWAGLRVFVSFRIESN